MTRFYYTTELSKLMEEAPVTYFGCPFHLNIDTIISNYVADKLIWSAPYKALLLTNSHLFTLSLFDRLIDVYDSYSLKYDYDMKTYCLLDKSDKGKEKSEIQVFNFTSKKELLKKVKRGYYDRVFCHFVDANVEEYVERILLATKAISFFTLDHDNSLYYKLGDEELKHFYRLYDDKSNKKIEQLENEGIIDVEKERLFKGLFEK